MTNLNDWPSWRWTHPKCFKHTHTHTSALNVNSYSLLPHSRDGLNLRFMRSRLTCFRHLRDALGVPLPEHFLKSWRRPGFRNMSQDSGLWHPIAISRTQGWVVNTVHVSPSQRTVGSALFAQACLSEYLGKYDVIGDWNAVMEYSLSNQELHFCSYSRS